MSNPFKCLACVVICVWAAPLLGADPKDTTSKEADTPSFRNEVIPILTRLGCNSGACHGALAGKGGMKLSLRGYAPEDDHFVLTRQVKGRRVNLVEPAKSLMLL